MAALNNQSTINHSIIIILGVVDLLCVDLWACDLMMYVCLQLFCCCDREKKITVYEWEFICWHRKKSVFVILNRIDYYQF